MDEITNISYNAIVKYFTSLAQFGYRSYDDVNKLIALISLNDMLDVFSDYINEESFKSIINAIYCLSGTTCLIDFPSYINNDTLNHQTKINYIARVTQDNILKISESNIIRVEA